MRTNNLVEAFVGILFINIAAMLIKYGLQKYDNKTTRDSMEKVYQKDKNIIVTKKYPLRLTLSNLKGYFLSFAFV